MSEKHESKLSQETQNDDKNQQNNNKSESRRKFIKGAAAVTPVILTVANRPVWARNCSLSGQLSGNLSDQDGIPCTGEGCSSTFWSGQGYSSNLYHPSYPAHMPFVDAFGRDAFPGKSLYDVVAGNYSKNDMRVPATCGQLGTSSSNSATCATALAELGVQAVTAIQNSASAIKYDLDLDTVILSFQKAYDNGTAQAMDDTKNAFARFNNQICPLPYGI